MYDWQTDGLTNLMDRPLKSSTSPNLRTSLVKTDRQTEGQTYVTKDSRLRVTVTFLNLEHEEHENRCLWTYLLDVLYRLVKTKLDDNLTVGLFWRHYLCFLILKCLCTLNRQVDRRVIHTDRCTHVALS